jgi:predicted lipoprotein with Yx(FWY)xxD motif
LFVEVTTTSITSNSTLRGTPMKRIPLLLAAVLVAAASGSAVASAQAGPSSSQGAGANAHAARATEVLLHHTSLGSILTTSSGFTLYEFTRDHGSANSCVKISGCAQVWPALETVGHPTAGPGVKSSLLSSIRIAGGASQVTYAGHPLYRYTADSRGATDYVGFSAFGGKWYALGASGQAVK